MPFNPKFIITTGINKRLVEIERVRGFLDAIQLKDDWLADMQKKALILESHHSTHIEGTALSLEQAELNKRQEKAVKYLIKNNKITVNEYRKIASCIRKTAQRDLEELSARAVIKAVAKSATDPTKHYVLL